MKNLTEIPKEKRVIVIGGGAAGLTCSYLCARNGFMVTLLEKNPETGKKLSMTGNGRANLTNEAMHESCYNPEASDLTRCLLKCYGTNQVISFFREIGILTRSEDGYIYPISGEAKGVARALELAARRSGVHIVTNVQAKRIERLDDSKGFCVRTLHLCNTADAPAQETYEADYCILATGGLAGPASCKATGDGYYMAELLGIAVTPRYPALTGLTSREVCLTDKKGIRILANVSLFCGKDEIGREEGEIQLTDGIVSGIPVMQLSRLVRPLLDQGAEITLKLDLFPNMTEDEYQTLVEERIRSKTFFADHQSAGRNRTVAETKSKLSLSDYLLGFSSAEINLLIARRMQLSANTDALCVDDETLKKLLYEYRQLAFKIDGVCDYQRAQVTAGGIRTDALSKDLESIQVPGLFCIGEVVDADGRCGGYNLQWAFMTAMAAATCILEK